MVRGRCLVNGGLIMIIMEEKTEKALLPGLVERRQDTLSLDSVF